jgi:hypothetical protein
MLKEEKKSNETDLSLTLFQMQTRLWEGDIIYLIKSNGRGKKETRNYSQCQLRRTL